MAKTKSKPVTHEEFVAALTELIGEMNADEILAVPGAYEVFHEHLNNEAIKLALENREDS